MGASPLRAQRSTWPSFRSQGPVRADVGEPEQGKLEQSKGHAGLRGCPGVYYGRVNSGSNRGGGIAPTLSP